MRKPRILTSLAAAATLSLCASPAALAQTNTIGNSAGNPIMNICVASIDCTYINFHHGKPTDVVKHTGTLKSWTLRADSVGGDVKLRILSPAGGGKFKVVRSSSTHTVTTTGPNTFSANIPVKAGQVLALSNDTSGLYMANAPSGTCVRYFDSAIADGWTGKPNQTAPKLHMLLSAHVRF